MNQNVLCLNEGMNEEGLRALEDLVGKDLSVPEIEQLVRAQKIRAAKRYVVDPRTGTETLYKDLKYLLEKVDDQEKPCRVCEGKMPQVVMSRRLTNGQYTFVTLDENAFLDIDGAYSFSRENPQLRGIDLVLWLTSEHKDLMDMSIEDLSTSIRLLGQLERNLLNNRYLSVQVVKNSSAVTPHPGFEISATNKSPKRINDETGFSMREGTSFATHVLSNSENLVVKKLWECFLIGSISYEKTI